MTELTLHDDVLPFKCENPECHKECDEKSFAKAIMLWGFIYLMSEENQVALIGLTCPKCKKTTIRKYRAYVAMDFLWKLSMHLELQHGFLEGEPVDSKWKIKYFSPLYLLESGFINTPLAVIAQNNETVYFLPEEMVFEEYSKSLQESWPFSISEETIPYVLEIENNQSYKAIPRTIPVVPELPICINGNDVYPHIDYMLLDQSYESVNIILKHFIKPNVWLYDDECFEEKKGVWKLKKMSDEEKLSLMEKNDLLIEEYFDFSISHLSWKRKSFQQNVQGFLNDLKAMRNRLDFELIFRTKLLNKYGRIFYYKNKIIEEQRFEMEEKRTDLKKLRSNPLLVDISKMGYPSLAKTLEIPLRWIHGAELMEKWGLTAFGIINLIQNHDLIAYDTFCSVFIYKNSLDPALIEKLVAGDLEQQKQSMQRLCFHPDNIAAFEDFHGEQLALEKMEMEDFPQPSWEQVPISDYSQTSKEETKPLTVKEKVIQRCQEAAGLLKTKNPKITLKEILTDPEFQKYYKGEEEYIPTSESGWRNWLKGKYSPQKGRRKGT